MDVSTVGRCKWRIEDSLKSWRSALLVALSGQIARHFRSPFLSLASIARNSSTGIYFGNNGSLGVLSGTQITRRRRRRREERRIRCFFFCFFFCSFFCFFFPVLRQLGKYLASEDVVFVGYSMDFPHSWDIEPPRAFGLPLRYSPRRFRRGRFRSSVFPGSGNNATNGDSWPAPGKECKDSGNRTDVVARQAFLDRFISCYR